MTTFIKKDIKYYKLIKVISNNIFTLTYFDHLFKTIIPN